MRGDKGKRGAGRAGKAALQLAMLVAAVTGLLAVLHSLFMGALGNYGGNATGLGEPVLLANVPVLAQRHRYSCALATLAMARSGLNSPVTEEDLTAELGLEERKNGMLPREFERYAGMALQGRSVELVRDRPDSEVLTLIYKQLQKGLPVPVYFATENQWELPYYDTHYSLIVGIDPNVGTFTVANAYGFVDTVDIGAMLDAMKYRNYRNKPLYFLAAEYSGVIGMNNIFLIGD